MKSVTPYGLPYFLLRRRKIAIHSVACSFPNLLYVIRRLIIIKKTKKQDCILFSPLECFATAVKISSWRKRKRLCGVVRAASSAPRARAMKENQAYENIHAQSRYSVPLLCTPRDHPHRQRPKEGAFLRANSCRGWSCRNPDRQQSHRIRAIGVRICNLDSGAQFRGA